MRARVLLVVVALAGCSDGGGSDGGGPPSTTSAESARCVPGGGDDVRVPDVRGELLADAIQIVEAAGLVVVGNGVTDSDPVNGAARVRAQEPPAGIRVSLGACVGFRTEP